MANPAPETQIPWNIEPPEGAIHAEMKRLQVSFDTAREKLVTEMRADAGRIAATIPTAAKEIFEAQQAAREAQEHAEAVAASHAEALAAITTGLFQIGLLKLQAKTVRDLTLAKSDVSNSGKKILEAWLDASFSPSPHTESVFHHLIQDFTFRQAVSPSVEPFAKGFDAQSAAVISEVKELAKDASVDVPQLIKTMIADSRHPEMHKYSAIGAFAEFYK